MFPPFEPWRPELDWNAPAGRLLDEVVAALPSGRKWNLIVFGSAPLQLALDSSFLSGDVDVIASEADAETHLAAASLLKDQRKFYVEVVPAHVFAAPRDWPNRAYREIRRHVEFTFPHPADILVAKVCRAADKDLEAFRLVRRRTGHPTPEEMIQLLRQAVDMYRPGFDEERATDPVANTRLLWHEIFGCDIDVRKEVIEPALAERRYVLEQGRGLRERLRVIGERGETA